MLLTSLLWIIMNYRGFVLIIVFFHDIPPQCFLFQQCARSLELELHFSISSILTSCNGLAGNHSECITSAHFCTYITLFCNSSFRSWRMPFQFTTLLVAALVRLLESAMLTWWIVWALKRNPQKLAHGRFMRMSPFLHHAHFFFFSVDLNVISSGEPKSPSIHESYIWIIVMHSWKRKGVL